MNRYFKTFTENNFIFISSWESKGLSNEKISSTKTSNYDQPPKLVSDNARIKFSGDLLKQNKITYNHGPIVNIYVVYRLMPGTRSTGFTIYAEKMYSKNFTAGNKNFCISLNYNGDNSYLFVNGKEIINFKAKDSKIVP